ncbi:MAG: tRNA (guanosine(46)-N7)-methyltransferase TrmB [Bacilli bacterium]|nr:tRNA (guanosine(46)-N7)-methyltransferase TrmB [Bacilli bacterium]
MRQRNKKWALPYLGTLDFVFINRVEPFHKIEVTAPAELEIGCGKGDFILGLATKNPKINYYGIDGQTTVLATAGKKLEEQELSNVKLGLMLAQDLTAVFAPETFANIYLNFSDPWPKVRHEKRRLTSPKILAIIDSVLKRGGQLIMKTDNHDLYTYSLKTIEKFGYTIISSDENYAFDEKCDAMSEYEKRFRALGNPIYRLVAQKGETK